MKQLFENAGINVISNIVCAGLAYLGQNYFNWFNWDFQIPLWLCFVIVAGIIIIEKFVCYCIRQYRIHEAIKTFTYGCFGNSYLYKWMYVKNPNGLYGYDPINIQVAESRTEPKDSKTIVFTNAHSVDEQKIRLIIRLTLILKVEKSSKEKIQPILDYLHWTENK